MKKIIFTSLISLGLLLSCNTSGGSYTVYKLFIPKTIEYKYAGGPTIKWEYFHSDIDSVQYTTNYQFQSSNVVLREQRITGDPNVSSIKYNYLNGVMTVTTAAQETSSVDYKLSPSTGMVTHTIVGDVEQPYPIQYNYNRFRTKFGDTAISVETYNYSKASVDGVDVARYEYERFSGNSFSIQQKGIVGEPYLWASGRFGSQSQNLLSKAEVMEDGEIAVYTFEYFPDDSGRLKEEKIMRNGVLYCTNTYTYLYGIITLQ